MLSLPIGEFEYGKYGGARTAISAARMVKKTFPVMSADDCGAYTIWVNPDGTYHAEFHRFLSVKKSGDFKTKKELRDFLSANWWILTQWENPNGRES